MICIANAPDAGTACSHSNQCQGECVAPDENARVGICSSKTTWSGCGYFLDDNRRPGGPKLCYD
jgi:hypothetical protein